MGWAIMYSIFEALRIFSTGPRVVLAVLVQCFMGAFLEHAMARVSDCEFQSNSLAPRHHRPYQPNFRDRRASEAN